MVGLLLKLAHDREKHCEPRFWKLFASIRPDLDRLVWCLVGQPWMGPPAEFDSQSVTIPFQDPDAAVYVDIPLWRPGSLGKYADRFASESIELWAIEPTRDDPQRLALHFSALHGQRAQEDFIRQHARAWLVYSDSMCWEIYAHKTHLLDTLRDALMNKPWVDIYSSTSDSRETAFRASGLGQLWHALHAHRVR